MKRIIFGLLSTAALCTFSLGAIDAGKPMPAIEAAKWYTQPTVLPAQGLTAVVLLDITSEDAVNTLRMLETIGVTHPRLTLAAVAINPVKTTDAVVHDNGPFQIPLAADDNLKSRVRFAETESLFPYAVLAQNGVVVWSGHPTELESVTEKVMNGKFSESRQKQIEAIRLELQMAIQAGLPDVISNSADKILKIAPDDKIAIQAKLFAFNNKGQPGEAVKFIQEICAKNPQDSRLRMMQLDFLLNQGNMQTYKQATEKAFHDFAAEKDSSLVFLTAYTLENAPYGIMDPAVMLAYAEKAYDKVKNQNTQVAAVAHETLARISAETGNPAKAVALQEKALALRKGTHLEQAAADRLAYYRKLLNLNGKR